MMDPDNSKHIPPMELPSVSPETGLNISEQPGTAPVTESGAVIATEQGMSLPQSGPPPVFDMNLGPQPAVATTFDPAQMISTSPAPSQSPMGSAMPQIADDNDLIEKEWVEKAKQIVEHTKSDPRKQNTEMNKIKADYLKKRYNKEVKLVEE